MTLPSYQRWITALVGLSLVGNVMAWLFFGLLPDEAYYWVWSQRLELSYYDHPPLIAWLLAVFTSLLGHDIWVLRLPAVLSWLVGAWLGYQMAQRIYGGQAGVLAVLVWSSLPIVQVGFHIVTPDSALILFSWLTVWLAYRAVEEMKPRLWLWVGVMGGMTMLAKYPGIFVVAAIFLTLLSTQRGRNELTTPWPWFAALIAVFATTPIILWNWQHGWASFAFQFSHGVQKDVAAPLTMFLFFLGGQLFAVMPWTFFAILGSAVATVKARLSTSNYATALLLWSFALPLLAFGLAGLTSKSGPNWPETAYVTGTVLLAGGLNRWLLREGTWRKGAVVLVSMLFLLGTLTVNALRVPHWMQHVVGDDFTPKRTQLSQSYGWEEARPVLARLRAELPQDCHMLVDNHARAGMVAWLLDDPVRVASSRASRISQYTLWRDEVGDEPNFCLYLGYFDSEVMPRERIPRRQRLPEGRFELVDVITMDNPDLSLRWIGVYRPLTTAPSP